VYNKSMAPGELKAWRTKRGMTQQQLADLLNGTSKRSIENWEEGTRTPPKMLPLALEALDARLQRASAERKAK
jgi:DNA-binding transcriptional regulator YiaG